MVEHEHGETAVLVGKCAGAVKENTHHTAWQKLLQRLRWPVEKIWNNGYLSGIAMAFFFALTVIFGKELEEKKVPSLQILGMRAVVTIPVLAILPRFCPVGSILGRREMWRLLALQGFLYGFTVIAEWSSFAMIHLADTEAILRLSAVLGGILGWTLKGDPLGFAMISGMGVCIMGTLFISQPPMVFGSPDAAPLNHAQVAGLLLAFAAAVFWAVQAAVVGLIDKSEGSLACVCWINVGILVSTVTIDVGASSFTDWPGPLVLDFTPSEWGSFLGVVCCVLLGELYAIRTYQQLSTGLALALLNLSLILITAGDYLLLGENLSTYEMGGIVMVLMGIGIMCQEDQPTKPSASASAEEIPMKLVPRAHASSKS
ncbi:unnamed protein product [Ostreobium quekettii]|uniref:EamA domain-containing protein n=1 Tax=Ostreobium quekettii TaxID=121088 RepID=A0A8S1J8C3_9CHLO|nr:unnamed protein product [Ostreobium quekettii]|eukprot:evm.model.scf_3043.2 EVM.evm.TU.scf_3043.2   scf_3043:9080-11123(+)